MKKRKVTFVLVDRANYGRIKPFMEAVREDPSVEMSVVCSGAMLLEKFGRSVQVVKDDGFHVNSEIYMELSGSIPLTMSKSIGLGILEFSSVFQELAPDFVIITGDRYEALAASVAASFNNHCIIHIQGGEVSGSIDESTRHCITKLAHYHFPATELAGRLVVKMGEGSDTVFVTGCPSSDLVSNCDTKLSTGVINIKGTGIEINPEEPYLLVIFHPQTIDLGSEIEQISELLDSINEIDMPTVWLWPNIDAGHDSVTKCIRKYRDGNKLSKVRFVKNYSPDSYLKILANTACAIGNSSSFIRETSLLGTPVVLIGSRQSGREHSNNVQFVKPIKSNIVKATQEQLETGKYPPNHLYGDGKASAKMLKHLHEIKPYIQKKLHYNEITCSIENKETVNQI